MSGISSISGYFNSPSGLDASGLGCVVGSGQLVVTLSVSVTIHQYVEPGIWFLNYLHIIDVSGNSNDYHQPDLESMGIQTEFEVINEPPPGNEETEIK